MDTPLIVVLTVLPERSGTGVETHVRQFRRFCEQHQVGVQIVDPYRWAPLFLRGGNFLIRHMPLSKEIKVILTRWFQAWRLRRNLARVFQSRESQTPIVLYAQDLESTHIALQFAHHEFVRVVTAVHFNISEAHEYADKGIIQRNGRAWAHISQSERKALVAAHELIFVSEYSLAACLRRIPFLAGGVNTVIPNFVDLPKQAKKHLSGDLIAIGSLEPRKNQSFLIQVIARCKALGYCYTLNIVGDGPDREALSKLIIELGVEDLVTLHGFCSNAAGLIRHHRALVHASRMESFGIVLIEAMAQQRPVFACAEGGVAEVFDDGVEGRVWDYNDVGEAAVTLTTTLENRRLMQSMSKAGYRRYRQCFSDEAVGHRWLNTVLGQDAKRLPSLG